MVGNGVTKWDVDVFESYVDTLYNFNLISHHTYHTFKSQNCHYGLKTFDDL